MVMHPLKPIFNKHSKVLILGTMPSVISRELKSYYAHPQNRFWAILEKLFNCKIDNKEKFLLDKKIALWDVIASCDIVGSSDNTIKNVIPNDIVSLISKSRIKYVFTTGTKAYKLYNKFVYSKTKIEAICLPSPSPANAKMNLSALIEKYKIIKDKLKEE